MTILSSETIHATTVAIDGVAVLIAGPSGAGKSDLALRLIDRGASLVSDDQTMLTRSGDGLMASAPATISGQLELRGLGIVECPAVKQAPVELIVRLTELYERFPLEQHSETFAGITISQIRLNAYEASAPVKVEWALRAALAAKPAPKTPRPKPSASL